MMRLLNAAKAPDEIRPSAQAEQDRTVQLSSLRADVKRCATGRKRKSKALRDNTWKVVAIAAATLNMARCPAPAQISRRDDVGAVALNSDCGLVAVFWRSNSIRSARAAVSVRHWGFLRDD